MTSKAFSFASIVPSDIVSTIPGFPRNTLVAGANIRVEIAKRAMVQLDYDLLYNSGFVTNAFFLEFKGDF